MSVRIDSHHHFWNYTSEQYGWISDEMAVLKQDFLPPQLQATVQASGIDAAVSVQARQSTEDTDWLLELANKNPFILAVVGWLPIAESSFAGHLERLADEPKLAALRHVIQDEPDDAFILGADFNKGISQLAATRLVYDILIFGKHLTNTIAFVDRHPNQTFVLDHIAKPTIHSAEFDERWSIDFQQLAKRENVFCKFSGVTTEVRDDDWSIETIQPYWDVAIEAFGPNRLMFGSDWPVCLLRTSYDEWVGTLQHLTVQLSPAEQDQFWGGTAMKAYGISV